MNTLASQVTLFSGPRDSGPIRPGHGWGLLEWMQGHPDPRYARAGPDTYAPRHMYGEYMRDVLDALIAWFPRPHTLERLCARVKSIKPRGTRYELAFEGDDPPTLSMPWSWPPGTRPRVSPASQRNGSASAMPVDAAGSSLETRPRTRASSASGQETLSA